jgi:hypothetical protein
VADCRPRAPEADATGHTKLARAQAEVSALRTRLAAERRLHRKSVTQLRRTTRPGRSFAHALIIAATTCGKR